MTKDRFELIENYLLGKMSDEERQAFELQMQKDDGLRREQQIIKDLIIGIEAAGLKEKLKKHRISPHAHTDIKKQRWNQRSMFLKIAASLFIFAAVGWWYFSQHQNQAGQAPWDTVFYKDPGLPTPMGTTEHYDFYDAMVDYKYGKYRDALHKFEHIRNQVGDDTLKYYKAMTKLQLGELEKAEELLIGISPKSALYIPAMWYRAGIAIKKHEEKTAFELLEQIPASPEYDKEKALKLLSQE